MAKIDDLNVNGLSLEDIRLLNTRNLSNKALKQALNRLASGANKRIRRMMRDPIGQSSPSSYTRPFSSKGLNTRAEIKAEFERARAFLDPAKKTHTLKGWKKLTKQMVKRFGVSLDVLRDPSFWRLYRTFERSSFGPQYDSETLIPIIANAYADGANTVEDVEEWLNDIYVNAEQEDTDEDFEDVFGEFYE